MTANLILGKDVSESIYSDLRGRIFALKAKGITPGLAVIMVGNDPASRTYVGMKDKKCNELGIRSVQIAFPEHTTQEELISKIEELNFDSNIHGILVQLPLPEHISQSAVIRAISPFKDVDCFHPFNLGRMIIGEAEFLPATPAGIRELIRYYGFETAGKHVVIVGRSNIVGKPLANILIQKGECADATVTVVNSRTSNIEDYTRTADILIVAIGRPRFIKADMVKEGAVIIDVGTNRIPDPSAKNGSRLVGDVDFDAVRERVSAITPVPGGVGPMTICMLMANTVKAAETGVKE